MNIAVNMGEEFVALQKGFMEFAAAWGKNRKKLEAKVEQLQAEVIELRKSLDTLEV